MHKICGTLFCFSPSKHSNNVFNNEYNNTILTVFLEIKLCAQCREYSKQSRVCILRENELCHRRQTTKKILERRKERIDKERSGKRKDKQEEGW
jgi:hypothetical protein